MEEQGVGAHSLAHNPSGVERHVRAPGWDYEEWEATIQSRESAKITQQVG
jgi:hypothetical protein